MFALGTAEVVVIILVVLLLLPLFILLFQWLWNITMPDVFGLNRVTFWQAFRLLLIAGFLFHTDNWVRGDRDDDDNDEPVAVELTQESAADDAALAWRDGSGSVADQDAEVE